MRDDDLGIALMSATSGRGDNYYGPRCSSSPAKSDFQVYMEIPTYKPPVHEADIAQITADNWLGAKLLVAAGLLLLALGGLVVLQMAGIL